MRRMLRRQVVFALGPHEPQDLLRKSRAVGTTHSQPEGGSGRPLSSHQDFCRLSLKAEVTCCQGQTAA